ncbi:10420_t:CDS:1 [Ambispora gerdemannii]|uniref:10420_t:CDS:1 n=1 Tax=Ambispora gerdemannii TaxID=144530 RepID=A0A9N9AUY2_9GLOM|nr:10420_t:CDS:1 [Ambispora gerdemannii]
MTKPKVPPFLSQIEISGHKALVDKFSRLAREDIERLSKSTDPHNKYSISVAKTYEAQKLNRYMDILPFEYNRVKLSAKRPSKTDYINASFIEAPGNAKRYIATQGTLQETIDDFWLMVWEQNSRIIVMLTKENEKGSQKCVQYWPLRKEQPIEFSTTGLKVSLESEKLDADTSCIERTIILTKIPTNDGIVATASQSQSRRIIHLQFIGWPDHGVPDSPDIILQLIRKTNELQNINRDSREGEEIIDPVVVHCSAGCGRTGTFCTIDSALALLPKMPDSSSDLIFNLVRHFREQRTHMVQTLSQYQYCYLAVLHKLVSESAAASSK